MIDKNFYEQEIDTAHVKLAKIKKLNLIASLLRLLMFGGMMIPFVMIINGSNILFIIVIAISLIGFLVGIKYDDINKRKEKKIVNLINICAKYIKRYEHDYLSFEEDGLELEDAKTFLNIDLDIVGKSSLYKYLCEAKSLEGQEKLLSYLSNNNPKIKDVQLNQDAIAELASDPKRHLDLLVAMNMQYVSKDYLDLDIKPMLSKTRLNTYFIILIIDFILLVTLILLNLFGVIDFTILLGFFVFNIILASSQRKVKNKVLNDIGNFKHEINGIYEIIKCFEKYEFKSTKLLSYQEMFNQDNDKASNRLNKLYKIAEDTGYDNSIYMFLIVQGLRLWDIRNLYYFEKWKLANSDLVFAYAKACYDIEALASLAIIQQTKANTSIPVLVDKEEAYLNYEGIYHPLLTNDYVVTNDFKTSAQTTIITGSNMSGKTTFIRALGTNIMLAYAGASVCATKLEVSSMMLLTSIRVEDDFSQGISTFYAEIKRIKAMVEYSKNEKPMLCFIDEIFKGTNAEDRIFGASKAIEKLSKPWIINIVTTHDAQLCELDVSNKHFAEYYEDDKLMFDYKIKEGPCLTRNAKYILRMAGIE